MEGEELVQNVIEIFDGVRLVETDPPTADEACDPVSKPRRQRRRKKSRGDYDTGGGWGGSEPCLIQFEET